ncbi:hypothetical protein TNCT_590271 [Trichonephila clavata]|uniref:Uncharacterized protein n=1 Tax=Trichonephila clavata TaxID=2740835 RepID=A0A8X6LNJ3_TRICU|nr:hypothetical protein TNCT_590271 [Trichonephila clavata]
MEASTFANDSFFSERLHQEFLDWISSATCCSILQNVTFESTSFQENIEQPFRAEALNNVDQLLPPFSTHLLETVSKKKGLMMKEPANLYHTVSLGKCSGFSVHTHGFDVTHVTVMGINIAMG